MSGGAPGDASPRILIVEDDPLQARFLASALASVGFHRVDTVDAGAAAVEQVRRDPPDLVFMDIQMPGGMDGVEAAVRLRAEAHVPVVFLTAHADQATLDRARAAEPYGYLIKPVEARHLRPTVEMALHKYRMEEERRRLTEELQAALAEVEELRELLPVCAWCRRVRDDEGYWSSLESYLSSRLSMRFTHGICRECQEKHFRRQGRAAGEGEGREG